MWLALVVFTSGIIDERPRPAGHLSSVLPIAVSSSELVAGGCGTWVVAGGAVDPWGPVGFGTLLGPEESGPWPCCGGVGLFFLCLLSLVGARGGVGSGVGGWGV